MTIDIRYRNIFKFYKYLSVKRKKQFIFLFILLILSGFLEAFSIASAVPFLGLLSSPETFYKLKFVQKFSDFFNFTSPSELFLPSTILFCVVILFSTLVRLLNIWFISYFTAKVEIDLSNIIFEKNIYQPYIDFTKRNSSEIISLLISKIELSTNAMSAFLRCIGFSIIAFSIVASLLIINWKIATSIIIIVALYYIFISKKVIKILSKNSQIEAFLEPQIIRIVQESIGGFRDLTINNTQKIYQEIFIRNKTQFKFINVTSQFLVQFPRFILEAFGIITIVFVGYLLTISSSNLSFITILGTYAFGAQKLLPVIQQIYAGWAGYHSKSANLKYILKELEREISKKHFKLKKNINFSSFKYLSLKNISFSYEVGNSHKDVLSEVSLLINKGDYVGIYGKTGSGKSTLLDILMGLLKAKEGKIYFNNIDLYLSNNIYSWRDLISHVPQEVFLKEGTIKENIIFDKPQEVIDHEWLIHSAKVAQILSFVRSLEEGFNTRVGERGIRLSGGQKQRISIARAIYSKKKILVLDESTSALDEKTEKLVIDSIRNLNKDLTIIMVTHRLKSLSNCNKVFKVISSKVKQDR